MSGHPNQQSVWASESAMDRLVETACALFGTNMGLVSILGDDELSFRSLIGLDDASVPPQLSVTKQMVQRGSGAILVITNALEDEQVRDHPLVTGPLGVRFFAGATISVASDRPVGIIGVLAQKPRPALSACQQEALLRLARMAGDILDQSQAERRLSEQLAKLRLAEQLAGIGHWRLDVETGQLQWSDEAYRIHGVSPETFIPTRQEVVALYDPDDRPVIAAVFGGDIPPGDSFLARIWREDGGVVQTRSSAMLEYDEDGRFTGVFGVVRDITAREAERAALVQSEANYRLLADNLGDVIARVAADGLIDYVSPAGYALLGYEPETVNGCTAQSFIHPDDWPRVRRLTVRSMTGASSERIQHRVVHRDGRAIWVESHCRPLPRTDGRRPAIVLTLSDISERKRLEQEWIAARDRAEAADRAKSEFLANMSHELRTPLTSVIGFSGLLQESSGLSADQARYVARIATSSKALLGVINDILDYSKLEANAVSLEDRPFSICEMIDGAAGIVEAQCKERGLSLVVDCASDLPATLTGDEGRLRQVTLNFLSNAVKFTASGQIGLQASIAGGMLRVAVSDTGIGIAAEKLHALFDRFSQADASTTRLYGGTGLGLSISRKLIERMGGTVGVESQLGRGSTFWFEVPARLSQQAIAATPAEAVPAMQDLRILVADDVAANRELITAIMTSFGATVDTVGDGAQAVDAVQNGDYDVVLMDVHMPVLDGLDATRAIRALPEPKGSTRIVALTANVQADQVLKCSEAGMDGHVGKPIRIVELVEAIQHAMATHVSAPAAQSTAPSVPDRHVRGRGA